MIDAMKQALEALDAYSWEQVDAARAALRAAIEQAEKQKPMHPELRKMWEDYFDKCFRDSPPQRQPLTEEELRQCFLATNTTEPLAEGWPGLERFARAIERAHGIGGGE
jgi:conjugal transfer/entry exclusion protein